MKKIFYNGTIITMDENIPYVEALCVENGFIKCLGSQEFVLSLKEEDDELIDLDHHVMLPGFIDAHSHFVGFANSLSQCDLSCAHSFDDVKKLMKNFIDENHIPKGEWVYGSHYDQNFLMEKKHPDKSLLDSISSEHPIVLIHASSHMGVVNTMALESQGINNQVQDPEGGKYGRLDSTGELDGYMEENAFIHFINQAPMIKIERMMELIKKAQQIYASYGITTIQDGMVAEPLFQLLQYAAHSQLLKQDIVGFIDLANCRALMNSEDVFRNKYHNHLKLGGYKTFLDGSPQGRTAWNTFPYQHSDGDCGYPILSDEQLYQQILNALQDHQQLLAHCNGDAAAEQYITQFENVLRDYPNLDAKRPVMIHAQLVRKDQLERMKKIGMIPSFFIAHTYYWGDIHIDNFGYERACLISPAKDAVNLKMPFTFHQDTPVLAPDMLKTIWCAVNRITQDGVSIGEQERITPYEALKAITIYPAFQYFEENVKGSLREGMKADLVILDQNPLTVNHQDIDKIKVLETIKDGNTIYKSESCS